MWEQLTYDYDVMTQVAYIRVKPLAAGYLAVYLSTSFSRRKAHSLIKTSQTWGSSYLYQAISDALRQLTGSGLPGSTVLKSASSTLASTSKSLAQMFYNLAAASEMA